MPRPRSSERDHAEARALMMRFAERTGLIGDRPAVRYLWTDAFAVCNFLALWRATREPGHLAHAVALVDQVHRVLGRYRDDDARAGWISGLSERDGRAHPTIGGLRIGKPLPERELDEPYDPVIEWERDGQYFHYLTQWMHALDQVARATGQVSYLIWARELADTAHRAFTYRCHRGLPKRMYWKLSVDLSRPQVPSMGQHDPLEGVVCCAQLDASAAALGLGHGPELAAAIAELREMIDPGMLETDDPLGLGGLLIAAYRLCQLPGDGRDDVVRATLAAAETGLRRARISEATPARRLAFRELGLAIGLCAAEALVGDQPARARLEDELGREQLDAIADHLTLRDRILAFWSDPVHRAAPAYLEHRDLNDVMLATALVPEGYLQLARPALSSEAARPRRPDRAREIRS